MYKIIGLIFISVASFMFFNRKCFICYNTYHFLIETAALTDFFIMKCSASLTYPDIFSQINYNEMKFYKNLVFIQGKVQPDIKETLLDRQQLENLRLFFYGLGRNNLESEINYLKEYRNSFLSSAKIYKEKYYSRRQSDMLYGISVAVILSIILI